MTCLREGDTVHIEGRGDFTIGEPYIYSTKGGFRPMHPKPMTYLWRDIDVAWWKTVKQAALLRDMNIRQFIVWSVNVAMDNVLTPVSTNGKDVDGQLDTPTR